MFCGEGTKHCQFVYYWPDLLIRELEQEEEEGPVKHLQWVTTAENQINSHCMTSHTHCWIIFILQGWRRCVIPDLDTVYWEKGGGSGQRTHSCRKSAKAMCHGLLSWLGKNIRAEREFTPIASSDSSMENYSNWCLLKNNYMMSRAYCGPFSTTGRCHRWENISIQAIICILVLPNFVARW